MSKVISHILLIFWTPLDQIDNHYKLLVAAESMLGQSPSSSNQPQHHVLRRLKTKLAAQPELWHHNLLDAAAFARIANEKGLGLFRGSDLAELWKAGLIRSDLVISSRKLRIAGLAQIPTQSDRGHIYVDNRRLKRRRNSWNGVVVRGPNIQKEMGVYFHPFRYYVLYHLCRAFDIGIHSLQYVWGTSRLDSLTTFQVDGLNKWTASAMFVEKTNRWNEIAEIAAATEPFGYPIVFGSERWGGVGGFEDARRMRSRFNKEAFFMTRLFSLDYLEGIRRELCVDAQTLDDNKVLHVLLRLMNGGFRERLKGRIGGSMLLLSMAEMIRRAEERAFGQELKEEDELGFGQWMPGARRQIFGSERVADAPRPDAIQAFREHGIDFGPRVRCYVEGDTEEGAISAVLGLNMGVEVLNLSGSVIEKRGRGVAFRDSLRRDTAKRIFSFVIIDGDREDYVRAVKQAAERQEMFGMFLISNPDFELANFTFEELSHILCKIAAKRGAIDTDEAEVTRAIMGVRKFSDCLAAAKQVIPVLQGFGKSLEWGSALISYATEHPTLPEMNGVEATERPVIKIVRSMAVATHCNYLEHLDEYNLDPTSGQLVRKAAN